MQYALPDLTAWVAQFLLPFFRIAAFFMVVPMIGTQLVPVRIRMGLALLLSWLVVPLLPDVPSVDTLSIGTYLLVLEQLLIGVTLGFFVQIFFHVVVLGGQIISYQMGLGFASISDPTNGISVVVLSQFYLMLTMLLFLSMNGHLVLIDIMVDSFTVMPIGSWDIGQDVFWDIAVSGTWLFAAATLMALPAVIALLVVNFAFGIMTKSAPQLNIFAIGFPFTMVFGLFIVWVSLAGFLGQYQRLAEEALNMLSQLLVN